MGRKAGFTQPSEFKKYLSRLKKDIPRSQKVKDKISEKMIKVRAERKDNWGGNGMKKIHMEKFKESCRIIEMKGKYFNVDAVGLKTWVV